jgi:uncharacterized ubiquitin-like protein YukD
MGFISVAIYRRKATMTKTITVNTDKEAVELFNKYGNTIKIISKEKTEKKDQELERHVQEIQEERIEETGQL